MWGVYLIAFLATITMRDASPTLDCRLTAKLLYQTPMSHRADEIADGPSDAAGAAIGRAEQRCSSRHGE